MKKALIIIAIGYLAGLMGSYTFYLINRNSQYFEFYKPEGNPDQLLVSTPAEASYSELISRSEVSSTTKMSKLEDLNDSFSQASRLSTPSVVYIKTVVEKVYSNTFLEWFFGEQPSQSYISTGSGVIYTSDGYIVTNNHVIENADVIEVIHQKRTYKADIISTDPSTDLAILKIDADNLPNIKIGSSRELQVGEWVLAIGNPFNLTSTVTAGIVSAKGRQINILKTNFPIESFIQTDAAINPGNSGGALINTKGELVGINTAILSRTGSYAGYGFAVPVDIVSKIIEDLIRHGEVQKAFIGAEVIDIDQKIGEELELENLDGVYLQHIQKDGAAAKAGLKEGDIIVMMDNEPVNSRGEFEEIVSYQSPGNQVDVEYKRNNKINKARILVTNAEGTTSILKREIHTSRTLGADFEIIPKVERDLLGLDYGVRVNKIRKGFFSRLDIREGFIITHINKIPIKDPETLTDILTKIRGRVYIEGVNKDGVRGYYSYFF